MAVNLQIQYALIPDSQNNWYPKKKIALHDALYSSKIKLSQTKLLQGYLVPNPKFNVNNQNLNRISIVEIVYTVYSNLFKSHVESCNAGF